MGTSFSGMPTRLIFWQCKTTALCSDLSHRVDLRARCNSESTSSPARILGPGPSGGSAESSAPGEPAASGNNDFDFDVLDTDSRYLFELAHYSSSLVSPLALPSTVLFVLRPMLTPGRSLIWSQHANMISGMAGCPSCCCHGRLVSFVKFLGPNSS